MKNVHQRSRFERFTALMVARAFFWSFLLAPPMLAAAAVAQRQRALAVKPHFPGFRLLSPKEMARIWGASSSAPLPNRLQPMARPTPGKMKWPG
jgi:hypothetical protein